MRAGRTLQEKVGKSSRNIPEKDWGEQWERYKKRLGRAVGIRQAKVRKSRGTLQEEAGKNSGSIPKEGQEEQ